MRIRHLKFLVQFLIQLGLIHGSSFSEPHDHQGVVKPFEPGDPNVKLDAKAINTLKAGNPYQTQIQSGTRGRGLVVQDVKAPTDIVWSKILDYDNYAKMVPKTVESKNYKVEKVKPTKKNPLSKIIYTRMKVGFPMLKLEFFIKHSYYPALNSLTWTLDYSKKSDFNDSCGYWYVIPHPDDKSMTRLFYSVEVSMYDWIPKFVVDFMSTKALTDATGWVKKFSELEFERIGGMKQVSRTDTVQQKEKKNHLIDFLQTATHSSILKIFDVRKTIEDRKNRAAEKEEQRKIEEKRLAEEEAKRTILITWTRLGLVTIVFFFALYNIHLAIS